MKLIYAIFACLFSLAIGFSLPDSQKGMMDSSKMMNKNPLSSAIFQFSLDFFKNIDEEGNPNIIFSPLGIEIIFSALVQGARGQTQTQLLRSLRLDEVSNITIHDEFNKILTFYHNHKKESSRDFKLEISNLVLANKDSPMRESYLKHLTDKYLAHATNEDFSNGEELRNRINSMIKRETNDMIKTVLSEPIDAKALFVLINTIYFKGNWIYPFRGSNTEQKEFWKDEKTSTSVKMMKHEMVNLKYVKDDEFNVKAIQLPYKGNVSMYILLPHTKNGLSALKKRLNKGVIDTIISKMNNTYLEVSIPKFKIEQNLNLNELLPSMGLSYAFTHSSDFSEISDKKVYISNSLQKAVIEVNEKGTEAAAATLAIVSFSSLSETEEKFIADHPFLYFIKDEITDLVLFMGEIKQPNLV